MEKTRSAPELCCNICGRLLGDIHILHYRENHPYCAELWTRAALGTSPITYAEFLEMDPSGGRSERLTSQIAETRSAGSDTPRERKVVKLEGWHKYTRGDPLGMAKRRARFGAAKSRG